MTRTALLSTFALIAALGAALPAPAQAAQHAGSSTDLCAKIAARAQKLIANPPAPTSAKAFYGESPLWRLAAIPQSGISLAPHVADVAAHLTPLQWAAQQKPPLTLTPEMREALDHSDFVDHLPDSAYYAANLISGTLSCYTSTFFTLKDGSVEMAKAPVNWSQDDGDGCGVSRSFGTVDQESAAFEDNDDYSPSMVSQLSVSRWAGDRFVPACTVTFHFAPRFALDQHFNPWDDSCTAKNCDGLRQATLRLVQQLQADPIHAEAALLATLSPAQRAAYQTMKADATVAPPEKPDDPGAFLDKTPAVLPLFFEGQLYLAEAGHATIGWRIYSDWDVKLFERKGKDLGQTAQFAIGMAKGRLENTEVK